MTDALIAVRCVADASPGEISPLVYRGALITAIEHVEARDKRIAELEAHLTSEVAWHEAAVRHCVANDCANMTRKLSDECYRAEKAEADLADQVELTQENYAWAKKLETALAAARAALRHFADSLSEFHGDEHHEDGCPDCRAMLDHATAIAAARAAQEKDHG